MSGDKRVWYADGLRFSCTQCGQCCSGQPGAVWVDDDEIAQLAQHLGQTAPQFRVLHTRLLAGRRSLKEFPNGDCEFLDPHTRKCSVYLARPIQCQTWPFWRSNLEAPADWAEAGRNCPGIGHGPLVPLQTIRQQVDRKDV